MKTIDIIRGAHRLLLAVIGGTALLAFTAAPALAAAGGGATPITCNDISPTSGTQDVPVNFSVSTSDGRGGKTYSWNFFGGFASPASSSAAAPSVIYSSTGDFDVSVTVTDKSGECTSNGIVSIGNGSTTNSPPDPVDDVYKAITNELLSVSAPGVLDNDLDDGQVAPLTAVLISDVSSGSLNLLTDGSFTYTSNPDFEGEDTFTYAANDGELQTEATVTIKVSNVPPPPDIGLDKPQTDFKIMMNYELGMHCTGFEFAYCCVLPVYNSILAQIVKPQGVGSNKQAPALLEGDPREGLDTLGRQTVVRDKELGVNGDFQKYVVRYWHDAQPRNNKNAAGQLLGKVQTSTQISAVEGNSLFAWNTAFDSAEVLADGSLNTAGSYNGADPGTVVRGNGIPGEDADNYQNAVWNHLYIYAGLEGTTSGFCTAPTTPEAPEDHVGNKCVIDQDCNTTGICNASDPTTEGDVCTGENACGTGQCIGFIDDGACDTSVASSRERDKVRLGVNGHIVYPKDCGPALHPMGPVTSVIDPVTGLPQKDSNGNLVTEPNDCGGFSNGNVLTFSGHTGTVVYTQMKLLENLPVTLTSPDIWEALGLPLTPFEDSIDFFADPGLVDEDSIRPFVAMKAQLYHYDGGANATAVLDTGGNPVIGFGTAPIDIPNCERCHSNPENGAQIPNSEAEGGGMLTVINSPNDKYPDQLALVQAEYEFWNAYYNISTADGDSDWYSRLKSAAISMLYGHDQDHGTSFTTGGDGLGGELDYPACGGGLSLDTDGNIISDPTTIDKTACGNTPQNTRLGHESVICQRCHADNVIAVVKSASKDGAVIPPITEAIHNNHADIIFADNEGRDGSCQGCHPAHRSTGDMNGYPITLAGGNLYQGSDNRDASGGCFVGRDVHSNPGKDTDGAETPEHLNAVGQYLSTNVFRDGANGPDNAGKGIWCTNCHNQVGQELWKAENMEDLVHGVGQYNIRAADLGTIIDTVAGGDPDVFDSMLDPKIASKSLDGVDHTNDIWAPDPGLCDYVAGYAGLTPKARAQDGAVATLEVSIGGGTCSNKDDANADTRHVDCGSVAFDICGTKDIPDGDFSVKLVAGGINSNDGSICTPSPADPDCVQQSPFCTTTDCVAAAQATLPGECNLAAGDRCAVPVPFSAATDGRDHWLSAGEPHCADCHAAPYVEQSGNINFYPPFNYPRKASLMRYSRGHQDITCQGCHESIHGLYPVTPSIDTTTYAQAAALNADGSHGPLKCGTCHLVGQDGIPSWVRGGLEYTDPNTLEVTPVAGNFDAAVSWMHTYTDEASPLDSLCLNCHGVKGNNWDVISSTNKKWIQHTYRERVSREAMDKAEIAVNGHVSGDPDPIPEIGYNGEDPLNTVCVQCHRDRTSNLNCGSTKWKDHLITGRVAEKVWAYVTETVTGVPGETCGW